MKLAILLALAAVTLYRAAAAWLAFRWLGNPDPISSSPLVGLR